VDAPQCPQCSSQRTWKDGLRQTRLGPVQRFLCRECGYQFSETSSIAPQRNFNAPQITREPTSLFNTGNSLLNKHSSEGSRRSEGSQRIHTWFLKTTDNKPSNRQICAAQTTGAKNLAETQEIPTQEKAQRGVTTTLILDYAWQAKKRGLAESTIEQRVLRLKMLVKRGADLTDPDSVSTVLARSTWTETNKRVFCVAYLSFARTFNIPWQPPKTRVERKLPFIPTEEEINQLIAGCGRKTATFLQVLKDTGARTAEAKKIRWTDIDEKTCTIRINNPVKGSLARVVKVPAKTIAMINNMPKTSDFVFNTNPHTIRKNFYKQRRKIASRLQNPRLKQIRLHTFRHWKATMEYHRTKNIKWVQQLLGHKKLENTDMYTQLINFESDEWHVAHARTLEEESKLIEAGFDYVRYSDKDSVAIYRKRK